MKSKNESGHAVFLRNFGRMILICQETGVSYQPPDIKISIANLLIKDTTMNAVFKEYLEAAGSYRTKVDVLQHALAPVDKKITRVANVTKACDVTEEFADTVKSACKKTAGIRISPKITPPSGGLTPPSEEEIVQISSAHTGIDNKIVNYEKLIEILKNEPNYLPNEDDLKINALEADVTNLKGKRADADTAKYHLESKRIARDKEMHNDPSSGAELAGKVKAYFKAVFGGNSNEYHDVARLKFK